jgi:glycosyltransferase involved in cell wall biosynthesis
MRERLSILYIAYPLLTVTPESAGGAEQMLLALEREMSAAGHRTTVAAAVGSQVNGRLFATGQPAGGPDQYDEREHEHNARILEYLKTHADEFDLIHDKSGSFFRHAAACPVPVLATLHLPRSFYREEFFHDAHRNLYFNGISQSQVSSFGDLSNFLGVIENGIEVEAFPFTTEKSEYLLWLGRICEEKGPHLAIAAAQQAGMPLVIAGQVYPFRYHQDFYAREIREHLNGRIRFVDTPTLDQKLKLLANARALLLTSTAEETSSLVAMEAMASGTAVVAVRRGAFPDVVADRETGFVVDSIEEMAQVLENLDRISPDACRSRVEQHFSASRMAQGYQGLYRQVLISAKEVADRAPERRLLQ